MKQRTHIEEYPLILTAVHISEILHISKPTAYALMREPDFPLFMYGKSKRVQRDAFFDWLEKRSNVVC